ncbi:MAG: histidine--tRNA ligase [Candidatus Aenigmarchaeota archaeon]|nr:histidine--tRNA ligase [Candidatus Aenigmarchaeota archaeon]
MFQPPRGTRDFLPEEMIRRQYVISIISNVFEKWGFDPLDTPAFEDWLLLSKKGGEAVKDEIYYFKDKSDRELGLRFEFTASLARVFANNPNLPKPFRRYQVGPVWRYDRPGSGRYREFWQADVDIIGAPAGEADALCVAAACDAMQSLGFSEFFIRINNRKISKAFLMSIGVDKINDALRSIDKLEKIGKTGVVKELKDKDIANDKIKKIMDFLETKKLSDARKFVDGELGKEGIAELETIFEYIENFGFADYVKFDVSLVRGLEYYTGPVFEINAGINVSTGGGGRYDNMIEDFGGKPTPATGISLGIDRLVLAMEEKKLFKTDKTKTRLYIALVTDSVLKEAITLSKRLIAANVATEFDLMKRSLSKELDYANAKGIPFVLVLGEKEIASGKAKLRNMKTGEEKEISLSSIEEIKKIVI